MHPLQVVIACTLVDQVPGGRLPTVLMRPPPQLSVKTRGAMRQRKLGSHTPPCHRRMVITTLFSVLLAALQRKTRGGGGGVQLGVGGGGSCRGSGGGGLAGGESMVGTDRLNVPAIDTFSH